MGSEPGLTETEGGGRPWQPSRAGPRWAGLGWGWAAGGYPAGFSIWNALAKRLLMKCRLTSGRHPPIVLLLNLL